MKRKKISTRLSQGPEAENVREEGKNEENGRQKDNRRQMENARLIKVESKVEEGQCVGI